VALELLIKDLAVEIAKPLHPIAVVEVVVLVVLVEPLRVERELVLTLREPL
jgi:hypothetical protein